MSASFEGDLAAWGKVITLRTIGRRSGATRVATVGFLEEPDGSLLVAAAAPEADWASNLLVEPRCEVEREGLRRACVATPLDGDERRAVIAGLILRYGTPSERLGSGPAFRLRPDEAAQRTAREPA